MRLRGLRTVGDFADGDVRVLTNEVDNNYTQVLERA